MFSSLDHMYLLFLLPVTPHVTVKIASRKCPQFSSALDHSLRQFGKSDCPKQEIKRTQHPVNLKMQHNPEVFD